MFRKLSLQDDISHNAFYHSVLIVLVYFHNPLIRSRMYRKVNVSIFCIVLFFSSNILAQQFTSEQFKLPVSVSIRAIQCINDYTLWFSGSKGVFGYTQDGGKTFIVDSLRTDTNIFDFRSLAVLNDTTILLINAGSPARIFKSTDKGKTWRTVYSDRKSTRLNSSHVSESRMPSSA